MICILFYTISIEVVKMIFPLKELVKFTGNVYELTVASSKRAYQMSRINDEKIAENNGKVVSLAAGEILSKEVTYRIENK